MKRHEILNVITVEGYKNVSFNKLIGYALA